MWTEENAAIYRHDLTSEQGELGCSAPQNHGSHCSSGAFAIQAMFSCFGKKFLTYMNVYLNY